MKAVMFTLDVFELSLRLQIDCIQAAVCMGFKNATDC